MCVFGLFFVCLFFGGEGLLICFSLFCVFCCFVCLCLRGRKGVVCFSFGVWNNTVLVYVILSDLFSFLLFVLLLITFALGLFEMLSVLFCFLQLGQTCRRILHTESQ